MTSQHRRARHEAQGPARGKTSEPVYHRPKYEAPANVLALLRSTWSKRDLLTERERGAIWDFLARSRSGPLTDRQLAYAVDIGRSVGIGFDDDVPAPIEQPPAHTDPRPFGGSRARPAQPWGPLPLRPPGAKV
jgi:hypothetical protein